MILTDIQWCKLTHNFWHGCRKLGVECAACYMFRNKKKIGQNGSIIHRLSDATFYKPLFEKEGAIIFTCSYSDFFLEQADEWREDAWDVIRKTPQHIWLILTKRPERIKDHLPPDWGKGWDNVWFGTSIGIQSSMHRAVTLASIPAKVRFISAEPLLEEIDFLVESDGKRIIDDYQWLILGGESGDQFGPYKYRPSQLAWYEKIVKDLKDKTDVAVFVKQLGCHLRDTMHLKHHHGGDINEFPKSLQIREFPIDGIEHML